MVASERRLNVATELKRNWKLTPLAELRLGDRLEAELAESGIESLYELLESPAHNARQDVIDALNVFYELHPDVAEAIERESADEADDEARARRDPKMQRWLDIKRAKKRHVLARKAYQTAKLRADRLKKQMDQAEAIVEELWEQQLDAQTWLF